MPAGRAGWPVRCGESNSFGNGGNTRDGPEEKARLWALYSHTVKDHSGWASRESQETRCYNPLEMESKRAPHSGRPKPGSQSSRTAENTRKRLIRSTTVLCVRRDGKVVMAADGQVTLGESVIKHTARKIRRLYQDKILAGFAGSTAD